MRAGFVYRAVQPYISVFAVLGTSALLVSVILFSEVSLQWATFLTGVLIASVLSMASRAAQAQRTLARRSVRLLQLHEKLTQETTLREEAESKLQMGRSRLNLVDEVLPMMIAFIAADGRVGFHNRAFRERLGLRAEQIDGRFLHEVLGAKAYGEVAAHVEHVMAGQAEHFVQELYAADGSRHRYSVQYLPYLGDAGRQEGFYALHSAAAAVPEIRPNISRPAVPEEPGKSEQDMFAESVAEQVIGGSDAVARILGAIEHDEFRLYCQRIAGIAPGSPDHYEVLIRLSEEEEGMMPPGAFFPLVEKYGMMPRLDRWVVQHVVEWLAANPPNVPARHGTSFFVNLAEATLADATFPGFVREQLHQRGIAGERLCFELTSAEIVAQSSQSAEFARQVRASGCRVALSGFGRDNVSFAPLHGLKLDFLKIDGGLILNILREPTDLARVAAICRVARTIDVKTVAELVESEECLAKLREVGVDFAQGFGISTPRPLTEL